MWFALATRWAAGEGCLRHAGNYSVLVRKHEPWVSVWPGCMDISMGSHGASAAWRGGGGIVMRLAIGGSEVTKVSHAMQAVCSSRTPESL